MARESHQQQAPSVIRAAVLTISDTRTPETDSSGQYLQTQLRAGGHEVTGYAVVKDQADQIRAAVTGFMQGAQVVLTSGGTGITGRDVTIPVIESLIRKPMPGFGELFRMLSYPEVRGAAMLSRAVGGLAENEHGQRALIFALPGSLNAVQTAWEKLLGEELPHLVFEMLRQG
ncbi:MogA/MoaB family molybdenum cofactor biosynthesis protein [Deinococcus peraridilitoris]|uniref:Molybdenum cofactor biosynthesis protein B n=1 Tax=Deinococcus peraridilitoris (strain DSM 19664 / LMG 22246 / CIP 109416 / KR-200) TaxID=937777 RepID=K9ZWE0_DEIPD|nr:MogA/MoaB family molybdenum cofactor biosynthesis protein [Deinococcus peraridilitoris]AFZ65963.1 molybdenum cofactor synthesis domain protein [Deinococcus peraridilitoris DSM 19664]